MKINALGYIGFNSPNGQAWKTFGPEVLALGLAPDGADGTVYLRMDDRHHRLAIHPGEKEELAYIGWEVPSRIEFEEALETLEAKKVPYRLATREEIADRKVLGMAVFEDPAKFRHEIYHGQDLVPGSFVPGRPISGFVAGDVGGIGHVVLVVPEVTRAMQDFAVEVLGFKILQSLAFPDPMGNGVRGNEFYRCNSRSHCMAYVPAKGLRGAHHIYIETKSLDDVGRALDIASKHEGMVVWDLGRLVGDTDVSFYLRTPSGFDVQYATGGMHIEDDQTIVSQGLNPAHSKVWGHKVLNKAFFGPTVRPIEDLPPAKA